MIGNAFARAFQRRGSIFRSQFEKLRYVFTRAARSLSILCTPCSEYYLPTGYLVHLEDRRPPEIFVVSVKTRQLETDLPKYKILHRRRVRTSPNEPQSNLKIQISLVDQSPCPNGLSVESPSCQHVSPPRFPGRLFGPFRRESHDKYHLSPVQTFELGRYFLK